MLNEISCQMCRLERYLCVETSKRFSGATYSHRGTLSIHMDTWILRTQVCMDMSLNYSEMSTMDENCLVAQNSSKLLLLVV